MSLTIQEMARRSGFSEPTLRYYEKVGLLGVVGRDESSGHRRYEAATADRVVALACLRSAGMTVAGMRRYVDLLPLGNAAAAEQRDLFADQAERLADDIERLKARLDYLRGKTRMWDARVRGDAVAERRAIEAVTLILEQFEQQRTE
ncbi:MULTISPECIES: MerR family transcriptional regulator [unclassified Streptomyces]|uniref:MerR family transcriptional regulator n=1 Tax=unclassified Streptomyces TaxID=2593676 RepID=UPI0033B46FD0|nr:MerR family transcriptional regulator [Streptomyces sp. NBC_01176]